MKIIAIGDFHGKFPKKLKTRIKKERPDLILCTGDFADTSILRKLEFRNWKKLEGGFSLEKIIGKQKYKSLLKKAAISSQDIIKKISDMNIPLITVYGNSDFTNKEIKKYLLTGIETICKKYGIKLLEEDIVKKDDEFIAGFSGYRGAVPKGMARIKKPKSKIIKFNEKWDKDMSCLFKKIKPSKTIFLEHDVPYGYFDKVNNKESPLNGKHVGDKYSLKYIKKYSPLLCICGHMHEYQGMKKLGRTAIINPGPAYEGKAAIIELEKDKIKSIKFIR